MTKLLTPALASLPGHLNATIILQPCGLRTKRARRKIGDRAFCCTLCVWNRLTTELKLWRAIPFRQKYIYRLFISCRLQERLINHYGIVIYLHVIVWNAQHVSLYASRRQRKAAKGIVFSCCLSVRPLSAR